MGLEFILSSPSVLSTPWFFCVDWVEGPPMELIGSGRYSSFLARFCFLARCTARKSRSGSAGIVRIFSCLLPPATKALDSLCYNP